MNNTKIWDSVKQPPTHALKQIRGGRLSGMTDISPQWRYLALTEQFGPCGYGWKYEIVRVWNEPGSDNQVFAFAEIKLYIRAKIEDEAGGTTTVWGEPIPGIGGSMLVSKEKAGLHSSDEGYKMAVTDAISVATKMLGVAADIYAGLWDGSKYKETAKEKSDVVISDEQAISIYALGGEVDADFNKFLKYFKVAKVEDLPVKDYQHAVEMLEKKRIKS